MAGANDVSGEPSRLSASVPHLVGVTPPPGLHAIYTECRRIYPDQPNPLQVTAVVKYWYVVQFLFAFMIVINFQVLYAFVYLIASLLGHSILFLGVNC